MGAGPQELHVTEYRVSLFFRAIKLAVRQVYLQIQVEQYILVFSLVGLAKNNVLPKKIPQGCSEAKKVEIFE
ncbi:hypothetical protein [Bacillus sp. FDAARGOS_1420]|uniref:hypothetical protein n=1 Tax=Bacillus sp. FDAARGOS_1420 TaxID=2856338 RepID=UPI001C5AFE6D|nr:hypothetical protein [Bacillus sp. FDAARGOS_1420]MBW3496896.1 hypothetical protein [Bacillus sp. FDAARGOS_1420]